MQSNKENMLRSSARLLTRARLESCRLMSSAALDSGTCSVNGVDLFYMSSGRSGLPLICMPGALGACCLLHLPLL